MMRYLNINDIKCEIITERDIYENKKDSQEQMFK